MASADAKYHACHGARLTAPLVGPVSPSHCHSPVELSRVNKGEMGDYVGPPLLGPSAGQTSPSLFHSRMTRQFADRLCQLKRKREAAAQANGLAAAGE